MNRVVSLSVAIIEPQRIQQCGASVGKRVLFNDQYIEREVTNWRRVPKKIELRVRKRAGSTLFLSNNEINSATHI